MKIKNEDIDRKIPSIISLENQPCPLGCKENDLILFNGYDRICNLPGIFSVVKCATCGLIRTNPRPTMESMGYYYPDHYSPYNSTIVRSSNIEKAMNKYHCFIKTIVKKFFQFNTTRIPSLPPGRMLEIGCASGLFMHQMAQQGWSVEGIEPSVSASARVRKLGYSVFTGLVENAPHPDLPYDLIVGWNVFEHLHHPIEVLMNLRNWLNDEGVLILSLPNAGSIEFNLFKDRWYALHLPAHLYHYSPKTLGLMFKRTGWIIEKIYHHRELRNLFPSTGYLLHDIAWNKKLSDFFIQFPNNGWKRHYLLYPLSWFLGILGQTGRMTIWARKDHD